MVWNIISDSSCDLRMSSFHSGSVRFETVPLRLLVGEREFADDDTLSVPELLAAMEAEKSAASSACPSPADFVRAFERGDRTVCFTISSQLSGTYHAACIAREMVLEEHPEKQIFVMDSRSASAGVALLVRRAPAADGGGRRGRGLRGCLPGSAGLPRLSAALLHPGEFRQPHQERPHEAHRGDAAPLLGIHVIADATPEAQHAI